MHNYYDVWINYKVDDETFTLSRSLHNNIVACNRRASTSLLQKAEGGIGLRYSTKVRFMLLLFFYVSLLPVKILITLFFY